MNIVHKLFLSGVLEGLTVIDITNTVFKVNTVYKQCLTGNRFLVVKIEPYNI